MKRAALVASLLGVVLTGSCALAPAHAAEGLPFEHRLEVYRDAKEGVCVFVLRLEQPFLADEFARGSYLRLRPVDSQADLVYPKETRFQQKHAEFYGRLKGAAGTTAALRLSYEIVSENLDGTRRVEVRTGTIEISVPALDDGVDEFGSKQIFEDWARQQNRHFAELLRHYPEDTFHQYCLLQSQARYGVAPPAIPRAMSDRTALETDLYQVVTGSMAIQESLQHERLSTTDRAGDLNLHVSTLRPPALRSLDYKALLEKKRTEEGIDPAVHAMSYLVPQDQYFVHFHSMAALGALLDLCTEFGGNLLKLYTLRAQDQRLQEKLENQLCLRRDELAKLFTDAVVEQIGVTGSDPFVLEGTDVTILLKVKQPQVFEKAARRWVEAARNRYPEMVSPEFNYRGHRVEVHYTKDRLVSTFIVKHDEYVVYSNSHRAIRRVIDTAAQLTPSLREALDYQYVTTIQPPVAADNAGYVFASEAFIKRLVGPAAKISEKRRLECFNNLVMLNNASLFYRLEYGRSPESLSELTQKRFIDPNRIVCPHGGAYAVDAVRDTCACSAHNRLRYLTPNVELQVLQVSDAEAGQYDRYKKRYAALWQTAFDPIAVRVTVDDRVKLEACLLPFANGGFYDHLRSLLARNPQRLGTANIAPSAVASVVMVPGRENIAQLLAIVPGIGETLRADPTLTDLKWLGDRVGLHFCDGEMILQFDPTRLQATDVPLIGNLTLGTQATAAALLMAMNLPVYVTLDVDSRDSAARLLTQLSQQLFLQRNQMMPGITTSADAYRLPDYKGHAIYVFSGRIYALKLRLHMALVGNQLVAATKPKILREVIDASQAEPSESAASAQMLLRLNRRGLGRMWDDLQLYWAEKSRVACHRNIIAIGNLCELYDVPANQVARLSEAKYGVRYFCPDHGHYRFDSDQSQVVCDVHGNRERSRQQPPTDGKSFFAQFMENFDEITAALRFRDDALLATVEIVRSQPPVSSPQTQTEQ